MIEPASTHPPGEQTLSAAELGAMREQWKEFRRFRRKSVILASTLETPRGTVQCVALDLSLGGARIRVHDKLDPLEQVTLILTKFGRFPAQIVWRNATEADPSLEKSKWTLLTPQLLTLNTYQDKSVESGKTYYYYLTATDSSGNVSQPSEVVSEQAPK